MRTRHLGRLDARLTAWLRSAGLFRPTASVPAGWRKVLLAAACVIAGAAVSLARTRGPGSLSTVWIEDAKFLLNQALNHPFWACVKAPISGYYQIPARLITQLAIQFPLRWAAAVMSAFAAAQYAVYGLVAYIASAPHLRSRWLRLLAAAPCCALPLGYTQANNDLVTVQFLGLYAAFWTALWIPGTRAGRMLSPLVMLSVSTTAALGIVLAPLMLARVIADRSKTAWSVAICWLAGVLLESSQTLEGKSRHYLYGYNGPLWVLSRYATRVVPRALFGERSLGGPGTDYRGNYAPLHIVNMSAHVALITGAWAMLLAFIIIAAIGITDPNWPLAAVAALYSVGIFLAELLVNTPVVQPRYAIAPALLLYTVVVAMLRPRQRERPTRAGEVLVWLPAAGLTVLLAVAVTLNFRVTNGRTTSPAWPSVVARAEAACASPTVSAYLYTHEWWQVSIPCSRFG